ncbi:hypothetical protein BDA99DRAFT_222369 [Phascolomyces articulosus]|uniref:GRAM domain-containing protein n=1 Tax=Phascolomyces articulosus TaxID=60185 RepID=A0AAD5P8Y6_9FUNG|nr:hypothetical protein BDA99DRAFT_222369 [Phascolomyces articulosus]
MNGRQGWLYISENYLGFYSFLLGVEKKQLIELKNIKDISKENSKRNMFADSLRIITKEKEENHVFSNMFRRDEVKKKEKKRQYISEIGLPSHSKR